MTTKPEDNSRWIPLESNPDVFNEWAAKAGLIESQAKFQDVLGFDDELLNFIPRPVKAVILLFPTTKEMNAWRTDEDKEIATKGQPKLDSTIVFIKQTIDNACGTMALLHVLANSDVTFIPHSPLAQFIDECKGKTPIERADLLANTPLFTSIHLSAASGGQTSVPANLDTDHHYTCFVAAPEASFRDRAKLGAQDDLEGDDDGESGTRIIELDGDRQGPIDRGECKDFLKDVMKIVQDKYVGRAGTIDFSMMALGSPQDED